MKKTIELDDAEDLVDEELEIFERESREASSEMTEHLIPPTAPNSQMSPQSVRSRGSLNGSLLITRNTMVSKKTQTDPDMIKPLPPIIRRDTSNSLMLVNNVRTLTRHLNTGARSTLKRTMSKKIKTVVHDDADGEEDEEDEFANLGNLEVGQSHPRLGGRVNKRAKLSQLQLLIHDMKVWFDRQKKERNEFPVFLKEIKSIQGELGSSTAALFLFVRYILMINLFSSFFWFFLVALPQAISFDYDEQTEVFVTLHLFLGTGRVANSWLFFSGYSEELDTGYKMYLAYLLIHFISIFGIFIGILKTIATDFIREGNTFHDQQNSLALNLFSTWDFSINSRSAIKEQMKSLESNFKDQICELTSLKKKRTVREMRIMYALRGLAWFIWVLLIVGAISGIVATVTWSNAQTTDSLLTVYGPTVALTAINMAVPFFMQQLTLMESYDNGRSEQYFTIFRVYIMRMISLMTFIITLIDNTSGECKQLYWGQEFYKLCIINTLSTVASLFKYPAFAYLLGRKNEVDLPSSLMSLIYFQGCIWFGNLFCPLLSMIASVANVIYFHVGAVIVKKCCQPPTKRYNSRNGKFFNSFLAFTVVIMIVSTCYIIVEIPVECGPYANPKFTNMFKTFSIWSDGWPGWLSTAAQIVVSAPVVVGLLFILIVVIYFLEILNQKRMVRDAILVEEIKCLQKEKADMMKEKLKRSTS